MVGLGINYTRMAPTREDEDAGTGDGKKYCQNRLPSGM